MITADDLCRGAQTILETQLDALVAEYVTEGRLPAGEYRKVTTWQQVPTLSALASANVPAGAVTSPGLVDKPRRTSGAYDATWRIVVGVYDRGTDHEATARRARTWAGLVRTVMVRNPTLGIQGVTGVTWTGEEYAEAPLREVARTLAGCAVAFDVSARDVVDLASPGQPVQSTQSSVSVRSRSPQE